MKRFQFRLQTLARVREQEDDQCRQALGEAMRVTQNAIDALHQLQSERELLQEAWRTSLEDNQCSAESSRHFINYDAFLCDRIGEAERKIVGAREIEAQAREKLVEARRQTRILENLKIRQRRRHQDEVEREEQGALDETATTRKTRKTRPEQGEEG